LAEAGLMCSKAPTTGAMLRLEVKNMFCVCAMVPYHDWARYSTFSCRMLWGLIRMC